MNRLAAVLLGVVSWTPIALAQDAPALSDPPLKRAPSNSEWTVQFLPDREKAVAMIAKSGWNLGESDSPEGKVSALPKSLSVAKDGTVYHETTRWPDGRAMEKWISGDLQVYEMPSGKIARSILPSFQYSDTYSDYRRSDFEGLEWVGRDNFKGVKEIGGIRVFEFRVDAPKRRLTPRELADLADLEENKSAADLLKKHEALTAADPGYVAYLDTRTQLPLYFDDGKMARVYKYSEQPGRLSIPPRFADELTAWKKELTRRPLPRP